MVEFFVDKVVKIEDTQDPGALFLFEKPFAEGAITNRGSVVVRGGKIIHGVLDRRPDAVFAAEAAADGVENVEQFFAVVGRDCREGKMIADFPDIKEEDHCMIDR